VNFRIEHISDLNICDECGSIYSSVRYSECPMCRIERKIYEANTNIIEIKELLNTLIEKV
jgi:hypothetical protein